MITLHVLASNFRKTAFQFLLFQCNFFEIWTTDFFLSFLAFEKGTWSDVFQVEWILMASMSQAGDSNSLVHEQTSLLLRNFPDKNSEFDSRSFASTRLPLSVISGTVMEMKMNFKSWEFHSGEKGRKFSCSELEFFGHFYMQ